MGRRVIDVCQEAILTRLDRFCGIYGALSAGRLASESPAFRFSFGDANCQKVNLAKIALNHQRQYSIFWVVLTQLFFWCTTKDKNAGISSIIPSLEQIGEWWVL